MAEAQWYVVHTYSGYENKVKANIEKTIENRKLQDQILEVSVPLQDVIETKNGVKNPWRYGLRRARLQAGSVIGAGDAEHGYHRRSIKC